VPFGFRRPTVGNPLTRERCRLHLQCYTLPELWSPPASGMPEAPPHLPRSHSEWMHPRQGQGIADTLALSQSAGVRGPTNTEGTSHTCVFWVSKPGETDWQSCNDMRPATHVTRRRWRKCFAKGSAQVAEFICAVASYEFGARVDASRLTNEFRTLAVDKIRQI
jgi:hypothetical protein